MELNDAQQTFFEKLKLLLVSNNIEGNIAKAESIYTNTIKNAQSVQEAEFLKESLLPILAEFKRHLREDAPEAPVNDASALIQDDGQIESNTNLMGYVNVKDEFGRVTRQKLDVEDDLDVIGNAVKSSMGNFNKPFHEDDEDPELTAYLKAHGRG